MKFLKLNIFIYAACLLVPAVGILYAQEIKTTYTGLRVWEWENIAWLGLGIPFLFLQSAAGLPNFINTNIPNKHRFLQPLVFGAVFGILDILVIKVLQHPESYPELPPFLQPFPYSIFLFFSGALEVEVFYRLIPMTLLLLLGNKIANGRYYDHFMWSAIILTALREPLEQFPTGQIAYIFYAFLTGLCMNAMQAYYFKKAGFLASLSMRLGHYLFWHILLGVYVQFVELAQ
jgi:hypothetical protein